MIYPMLIDGEWYTGSESALKDVINPATGEVLGQIPLGTREDAGRAVEAAHRASKQLARMTVFERAELCVRIADAVERNQEKLARLLAMENGKTYSDALGEVKGAVAGSFREAAEQIKWMNDAIIPLRDRNMRSYTYRKPRGVYGIISPWNFPLGNPSVYYLAPGLAAGNALVWVPALTSAAVASEFMRVLEEAELPKGALNLVIGEGPVVGDAVVVHERTNAIGFTGSTPTGNTIAARAKGKPCLLELGGNGPTIVLEDADLDLAAAALVRASFANAGQVCTSTERVLVHDGIADRLVSKIAELTAEVKLGDPFDGATTMGPVHTSQVADKVLSQTKDAIAKGAKLIAGGKAQEGRPTGQYIEPTILDHVTVDADINVEETFGPVLPILRFNDESELPALIASSPFRLAAAIFSKNIDKAMMMAEQMDFGYININEGSNYWDTMIPAGGASGSASGVGRSGGKWSIEEMTELRTVNVRFSGV
ncbi:aldehyde dehydrogenase family protein [Cohnella thailandensis]|uniref:Aldehyde dehydrogenase n=1 Tax=Cohnella thailandensis TaxID=557557 RepID=A0A841T1A9_9BACL|nr:aldehyde dehydrogenase family protein [Cohnella thailandensis]MBB6635647.1 aldehyde dehydrogenase [Cohnella thailandensis]MBP1976023.1 succinate-semialdehyde dehydrogenase/glutarate-semialdehyde dehydrogenase [Cohnella thailandensis]